MDSIFYHSDYREVLREYYEKQKTTQKGFSLRSFASDAGLKSAGFIQLVMEGKKNLGESAALQLAQGMNLSGEAIDHFIDLVRFSRAKTLKLKRHILDQINSRRRRNNPALLSDATARYLNDWYLPALREMVSLKHFKEDPNWIHKRLAFPASPQEIRDGLQYLKSQGFIEKDAQGRWKKTEKTVASGQPAENSPLALAAKHYHSQMADLARQALDVFPREERYISGSTLSFSKEAYQEAIKRIRALRYELLELSSTGGPQQVYQLAVHLFPMTHPSKPDS